MTPNGLSDESRRVLAEIGGAELKAIKRERMARLQKAKFEILHAYRLHDDDPDVVAFVEQLMGELKAK
jgi:hypothetical protein